jgi:hypothetical protein
VTTVRGLFQRARPDGVAMLARDALVAQHLEIAAYEMLDAVDLSLEGAPPKGTAM